MKAVDTNVLARFLVNDDAEQSPIATRVLAGPSYIADTVLVETAWLLSSRYGFGRAVLAEALLDILNLPTVEVSDPALIGWAVRRFAAGADLADMMHLIGGRHADAFVSFETKLATQAGPDTPVPIERAA